MDPEKTKIELLEIRGALVALRFRLSGLRQNRNANKYSSEEAFKRMQEAEFWLRDASERVGFTRLDQEDALTVMGSHHMY